MKIEAEVKKVLILFEGLCLCECGKMLSCDQGHWVSSNNVVEVVNSPVHLLHSLSLSIVFNLSQPSTTSINSVNYQKLRYYSPFPSTSFNLVPKSKARGKTFPFLFTPLNSSLDCYIQIIPPRTVYEKHH
jgi:hypothetical protein